jgi:hypothetical protein
MDHEDLFAEIKYALIDNLTAANIHVHTLLRKLEATRGPGGPATTAETEPGEIVNGQML